MRIETKKLLLDALEAGRSIQKCCGYDAIDDELVWGIVERHLPQWVQELERLLVDESGTSSL